MSTCSVYMCVLTNNDLLPVFKLLCHIIFTTGSITDNIPRKFYFRIFNFKVLSEDSNIVVVFFCCLYSYANSTCLAVIVKHMYSNHIPHYIVSRIGLVELLKFVHY